MIRLSIQILPLILLFALPALAESAPEGAVKVGVSLPLSGFLANYGEDVKNALLFANERIAQNRYQLVIEDDHGDPKRAASVAHKLASVNHVNYVLGLVGSGSVLAAAPIYEKNKVVAIASVATSPKISSAGDYIFRTTPSDAVVGQMLNKLLLSKYDKIAIASEETNYCEDLLAVLQGDSGLKFTIERFQTGSTDFRSLIMRLKTRKPDALFLNPQTDTSLINLVTQIRSLRWQIPLYGAYFPSSATFLTAVGQAADGIVFFDFPDRHDGSFPGEATVLQDFIKRFGAVQTHEYYFVTAFNSFLALHQAISSGSDVREYLYTHNFNGAGFKFSFDTNGDIVGVRPVLKRIRKGTVVLAGEG